MASEHQPLAVSLISKTHMLTLNKVLNWGRTVASHLCLDTGQLFWQSSNPIHESWRPECVLSLHQGGSGCYLQLHCFLQKVLGSTGACSLAVVSLCVGRTRLQVAWLTPS